MLLILISRQWQLNNITPVAGFNMTPLWSTIESATCSDREYHSNNMLRGAISE